MITARFKMIWRGKDVEHMARSDAVRRLNRCAVVLQTEIIGNISESTRANGPSLPHQFPHADTGRLRQSVTLVPASVRQPIPTARIGTNLRYGRYLELGTRHMAERSFLRRTLRRIRPRLRRMFREG